MPTGMTAAQRHLATLTPTSVVSDLATPSSGLHDAAAREAVARLVVRLLPVPRPPSS